MSSDAAKAAYPDSIKQLHDGEFNESQWMQDAFDRGQVYALRTAATEIGEFYPVQVWPDPTPEQVAKLHDFARSIGMSDGSRFHVRGIRHSLGLVRARADAVGSQTEEP